MDKNLDQKKIKEEIDRILEEVESKMGLQDKLVFFQKLNDFVESFNQDFSKLVKMTEEEEKLLAIKKDIKEME